MDVDRKVYEMDVNSREYEMDVIRKNMRWMWSQRIWDGC
jgi:hypothetical protein